jgi:hypothetical protein
VEKLTGVKVEDAEDAVDASQEGVPAAMKEVSLDDRCAHCLLYSCTAGVPIVCCTHALHTALATVWRRLQRRPPRRQELRTERTALLKIV